jgi:predicted phosphate transport protein (TIGR00153 family)
VSRHLLSWFEQRRKTKTLELAKDQILKSINTVSELERAITHFSNNERLETEEAIKRLFLEEIEIDELRRAVFSELTTGTLPAKYREDLKALVGRLDRFADFIKDAARSIRILLESRSQIPKGIMDVNVIMTKTLVECTKYLSTSIEMLGVNVAQANEFAKKVDEVEGHIDDYHLRAKILFFDHIDDVPTPVFLILNDLIESIESAADMCADTADLILVLASGEAH